MYDTTWDGYFSFLYSLIISFPLIPLCSIETVLLEHRLSPESQIITISVDSSYDGQSSLTIDPDYSVTVDTTEGGEGNKGDDDETMIT